MGKYIGHRTQKNGFVGIAKIYFARMYFSTTRNCWTTVDKYLLRMQIIASLLQQIKISCFSLAAAAKGSLES